MNDERIESIMTGLGFSHYEAKAYAALVREYPLTGYELARCSGIPRSKIYECIERLNRKRLIMPVGTNPARYVAVPPDELVRRLTKDFKESVSTLESLLTKEPEPDNVEYTYNLNGYSEIIGKAEKMISEARKELDLSLWDQEIRELQEPIRNAAERGVAVRILSFNGDDMPGFRVFHHRKLKDTEFTGRWITIVKDESEVLTGQCSGEGGVVAAWTRNKCLVFISLKYIEHEIIKIEK